MEKAPEESTALTQVPLEKDDRVKMRLALEIPVRVEGRTDATTTWSEMTRAKDVSAFGVGFNLTRPVKRGRILLLSLPMPRQLRSFDYMEQQYRVYAIVRRCVPVTEGKDAEKFSIGVAFVGKNPPVSWLKDPTKTYDIQSPEGGKGAFTLIEVADYDDDHELREERRRHTRFPVPISVLLESLDSSGQISTAEMTVTENISLGGAAVFASIDAEIGSFIRFTSQQYNVTLISVVRARRIGPDGIPRLHLEFVDRLFPLEGIGE